MKTNKTNKVSFTPGPWKVLEIKNDKELMFIVKSDERMIGSFHGFYSDADDKLKADANLIAAAPEMFSILQDCLNELDKYKNYFPKNAKIDHLMDIIGLTINKARGE